MFAELEYRNAVRAHAAEVLRIVREEGVDLHDAIHEAADGSQWVIYTARARFVLAWSKYADAAWGVDGVDTFRAARSMDDIYTTAACFALRQDIADAIEQRRAIDDTIEQRRSESDC